MTGRLYLSALPNDENVPHEWDDLSDDDWGQLNTALKLRSEQT